MKIIHGIITLALMISQVLPRPCLLLTVRLPKSF